jgi:hypothetical protein
MRTVAITSLIALGSALFAGGPSADQLAGLMKAGAAIQDGASITTKFGGSTVSVTRQNGVVTCTVDGKPIALRVRGPAPKPAALMPVAMPAIAAQQASQAATPLPLFQNSLIWIGSPNPFPPPGTVINAFSPLAELPDFAKPMFGWMEDFEFEACVLGLSSVTKGQGVVGPYGTSTSSFSTGGC